MSHENDDPILTVIGGGQSLACGGGARALPPGERATSIDPPDPYHLLMLNFGPIAGSLKPIDPAAITALAPIREDANRGESQGTALLRLLAAGDPDPGARATWLYLCHAVPGQPFSTLGPGSVAQANGLVQLRAAVELARRRGQPLRVVATTWSHGEADRKLALRADRKPNTALPAGELRRSYRQLLWDHAASAAEDYRAITGQAEPVWTLVDQLAAAANGGGPSEITLAQGEAIDPRRRLAISCPRYLFRGDFGYLDNVHFLPLGYAVLGEYHAKAIRRLLDAETVFEPCLRPDPASIERDGRDLRLGLIGARGAVTIDTTSLPPARHHGFGWTPREGDGGISRVDAGGNGIAIELSEPGPGTLSYAMTRQAEPIPAMSSIWGNIRDSDPTPSIAMPGLMLHNWLIAFELDVA